MFDATKMLFIYVETPLHVGSGRGLGAVDLPIQRERTTHYPIVQASSLKGRMRGEARAKTKDEPSAEERAQGWLTTKEFLAIFGPEAGEGASEHAGAISFGDARILLFPVRSLAGVFAWTTSVDAIARFRRAAQLAQTELAWDLPEPPEDKARVNNASGLVAGESVVLEEFSFTPDTTHAATIQAIGNWLAQHALPQTAEYTYWREQLPKKLCILPENAFRDFVQYGTEVQTHIALNPTTKTVDKEKGALWTAEALPIDTLLYAPVMATNARTKVNGNDMKADEVLKRVVGLQLDRTQLGGDETTGQGFVALRWSDGGEQ